MPGVVHLDDSVVENLMSFQIEVVPMNDSYDVVRRLRVDHQTAQQVPFHFDVLRRSRAENAGVDCGNASFFRVFFRFVCHSNSKYTLTESRSQEGEEKTPFED